MRLNTRKHKAREMGHEFMPARLISPTNPRLSVVFGAEQLRPFQQHQHITDMIAAKGHASGIVILPTLGHAIPRQ